ncbi:MAG: helix-turn-helix domain-containing protein [Chloroflexi bacterium]|nr:helix-turn-helix domain-containing protein [Chloroflexota bacterium]
MEPLALLTFAEVAALLKVSVRTIERMADDAVLERRGARRLRRITERSVRHYLNGDVTWGGRNARATAGTTPAGVAGTATEAYIRTRPASGGRKSASRPASTDGRVVILKRTPSKHSPAGSKSRKRG